MRTLLLFICTPHFSSYRLSQESVTHTTLEAAFPPLQSFAANAFFYAKSRETCRQRMQTGKKSG